MSTKGDELKRVAKELNTLSDELTQQYVTINEILKTLNIGIEAWVTIDEDTNSGSATYLGYARLNETWGLLIAHGPKADLNYWHIKESPRAYRLVAIDHLQRLIDALTHEVLNTTKKIEAATKNAWATLREWFPETK